MTDRDERGPVGVADDADFKLTPLLTLSVALGPEDVAKVGELLQANAALTAERDRLAARVAELEAARSNVVREFGGRTTWDVVELRRAVTEDAAAGTNWAPSAVLQLVDHVEALAENVEERAARVAVLEGAARSVLLVWRQRHKARDEMAARSAMTEAMLDLGTAVDELDGDGQ